MVLCTYCGLNLTRAEHLNRHVMTHLNIKPFKCNTCHSSFKRRDLLHRHNVMVHRENEESCSEQESQAPQRRAIACVACARAKTRCDKIIPNCSRCTNKGIICETRCTKRSNDAAYRLAKRQLSLYRRPVPIVPAENSLQECLPLPPNMMSNGLLPGWDFIPQQWNMPTGYGFQADPPAMMNFGTLDNFPPTPFNSFSTDLLDITIAQPSPGSIQSSPSFSTISSARSVLIPSPLHSADFEQNSFGYEANQAIPMSSDYISVPQNLEEQGMFLDAPETSVLSIINTAPRSLPVTPSFLHQLHPHHALQD